MQGQHTQEQLSPLQPLLLLWAGTWEASSSLGTDTALPAVCTGGFEPLSQPATPTCYLWSLNSSQQAAPHWTETKMGITVRMPMPCNERASSACSEHMNSCTC